MKEAIERSRVRAKRAIRSGAILRNGCTTSRGRSTTSRRSKNSRSQLEENDEKLGTAGNRLYYLSTPPGVFAKIVQQLAAAGLGPKDRPQGWSRIIIEKPFGTDLESARALQTEVTKVFEEKHVYRIDHYLGKEPVQDIMALRFANVMFEPIWNRRYIDCVQITAAETVGVEGRGGYYENAGALRDMIQNHVINMIALVAMEPPISPERRPHPRRKIQSALGDASAHDRRGSALHRARAIRSRARRRKARCRAIARSRASIRIRPRRPTPPSSFSSTIGAGPTCRSICAAVSGSRASTRKSRSVSAASRIGSSARRAIKSRTTRSS